MAFPLIAAGASLLGTGAQIAATGKMNARQRNYNTALWGAQNMLNQWNYERQRGDNLADWNMQNDYNQQTWNQQNQYNEGLWNKQNAYNEQMWQKMRDANYQDWQRENEYNSPQAQMQRFKDAGLNPNLIYGQTNGGGSISTANFQSDTQNPSQITSDSARGAAPSASPHAGGRFDVPNFDFGNGIMAYYNARQTAAQTNNLEATNQVIKQDALLRTAQTAHELTQGSKSKFDLDLASELKQTSVDAAQANLRKLQLDSDLALNRDEREAAMNASNLREAAQRIMNMRGQQVNQALDAQLKSLDLNLKQMGIQPTDNMFIRMLGQLLQQNKGDLEYWLK